MVVGEVTTGTEQDVNFRASSIPIYARATHMVLTGGHLSSPHAVCLFVYCVFVSGLEF